MARITLPEVGIETLFGSYDENLKHLESQFGVRVRTQGHDVIVDGPPAEVGKVERLFTQLGALFQEGYRVSNGDVKTAAQLVASDPNIDLREYFLKSTQTQSGKRRVAPKTINQRRYLDAIEQNDIVFGIGPAGTGKTYLAMAQAVSFLLAKRVNRIILARPAVEAGEKLGFLPGDLQEKVNPYLRPLYDALYDMVEVERAERLIERGTIEIAPIAFMRGRTLNDAFVILDEAQNTTSEQMKMFLTRLGFGSKAVVTGDITQIDLPIGRISGLVEAMKVVSKIEGISFIHFDDRDVVRHKLVQQIVKAYESFTRKGRAESEPPGERGRRGRNARGRERTRASGSPASRPARPEARSPSRFSRTRRVRALNRRYRRHRTRAPTSCRSRSAEPGRSPFLGDIAISRGIAQKQAKILGHSLGDRA